MIIKHPTMEPFFIEVESDGNHTVKKNRPPTPKQPNGYSTAEGYFPNVESALTKIIKLKASEGEKAIDLGAYLYKLEKLIKSISKIKL